MHHKSITARKKQRYNEDAPFSCDCKTSCYWWHKANAALFHRQGFRGNERLQSITSASKKENDSPLYWMRITLQAFVYGLFRYHFPCMFVFRIYHIAFNFCMKKTRKTTITTKQTFTEWGGWECFFYYSREEKKRRFKYPVIKIRGGSKILK